jgi:eukaryotic-like serine/threonine-protein kinase
VLGEGGFGQVFSAIDTSEVGLGDAAVKVLHPNTTPQERADFLVEVKKIASLRHPNLVGYLDSGQLRLETDEGGAPHVELRPYLVTERCAHSLTDHARRSPTGTLSESETLAVLADVSAGLSHLHHQSQIHRDIKPGNVLFAEGRWKLADFGLMRDLSATGSYHRAGMLMGTPLFMSPELFDSMMATPASDIYAVGVLGHLCSTGKHLHSGVGPVLVHNLATQPPALDPGLPIGLQRIVSSCTHPDPQLRPSADELRQLVSQAQAGGGPAAPVRPQAPVPGNPAPSAWSPSIDDGRPAPATSPASGPWAPPAPPTRQPATGWVGSVGPGAKLNTAGRSVVPPAKKPRLAVLLAGSVGGLVLVAAMGAGLIALTGGPDQPDQITGTTVVGPNPGAGTDTPVTVDGGQSGTTGPATDGSGSSTSLPGGVRIGNGVTIQGNVVIGSNDVPPVALPKPETHLVNPVCPGNNPAPVVELVNRHDTPVNYLLDVYHYNAAGVRVDETYDSLSGVSPGQRALLGLKSSEESAVSCQVASFTASAVDPAVVAGASEVTINSCKLDEFFGNYFDIEFTVTNPTAATADAEVTFAVIDGEGVVVDQSIEVTVNSLGPGEAAQQTTGDVYNNIKVAPRPPKTCIASQAVFTPR